jgi:hypothetical protein
VFNVALALFYCWYTFYMWAGLNNLGYVMSRWNPFYVFVDFGPGVKGIVTILNVPFWLFWVSMAVNMYYIVKLQKSKETQKQP